MNNGMNLLYNIVDEYTAVVKTTGHAVKLSVFNEIVKDLLQNNTGTEFFNRMTIILGGPTMPVTITDDDDNVLFVLPAIYDGSSTLNFTDTLLAVNKKREEHMQGSGKPIEQIIGLPTTSNKEKWGLYLKYVKEQIQDTTPKQEIISDDDIEIED